MKINFEKNKYWYLVLLLFSVYLISLSFKEGDFKVFLMASEIINEGGSPYGKWLKMDSSNELLYFYSPLWSILLTPFTYLPNYIINLIWLILNLFFLIRIFKLLESYNYVYDFSNKIKNSLIVLCLLLNGRFILYNFELIQMTIFLLWGILESLKLISKGKQISASILIAFIINVKILPIVILPYLIFKLRFKTFFLVCFFSILFLFLPALIVGWQKNYFLLAEWFKIINPQNQEHLLETDLGPHSLTALIPSLLTETNGTIDFRRSIVNLSIETVNYILNFTRLIFIISTLYILDWSQFKSEKNNKNELFEIAYIVLLIPLVFPHQQKYAFLFALPCQFFILTYIYQKIKSKMKDKYFYIEVSLLAISFILMTLTTDGLIGRNLNNFTQHYKFISYGGIILLISMLILQFEKKRFRVKNLT